MNKTILYDDTLEVGKTAFIIPNGGIIVIVLLVHTN